MNPDVKQRRPGDYSVFKIAMGYMGEGGGRGSLRIGRKDEIPKRFVQDFKNNIIIIGKFSKSTIISTSRKSSTASVNQLFQI